MKSNIEYLKEAIKKGSTNPKDWVNECYEWIDDIEGELGEVEELKTSVKYLEKDKDTLKTEVAYLESEIEKKDQYMKVIDCGIGIIEYVEPDNLKLRCLNGRL